MGSHARPASHAAMLFASHWDFLASLCQALLPSFSQQGVTCHAFSR